MLALLVVAQLVLPRLAENEVRRRLGGGDEVLEAKVEAWPAIELLWRHADRVTARVRSYDASSGDIADDLAETTQVGELDVRMERVRAAEGVELQDVRVAKRHGVLTGSAVLDPDQLASALPPGVEARLVPQADGTIVAAARIAGVPLPVRLQVIARDGEVVARPTGLLGIIAGYTLFSDPRIEVESVGATPLSDGRFQLHATARLR